MRRRALKIEPIRWWKNVWGIALLISTHLSYGQALNQMDRVDAIWKEATMTRSWVQNLYPQTEIEPKVNAAERDLLQKLIPLVRSNPSAARDQLQQSLRSDSSAALSFMLGAIYYEIGDYPAAEKSYRQALEKFSNFQRAFQYLGMTQLRQDQHQKAIPNLNRALELGGQEGALWGSLGYAYLLDQDWTAGRAAYQRAVALNPDNFEWRLGLAQCDLGTSNYPAAVAALETLSDKRPERSEVWLYLANAYLGSDQPAQAAMALEAAEKLGRKDVAATIMLGDIYTNLEMIQPALLKYQSALKLDANVALASFPRAIDAWVRLEYWEPAKNLISQARLSSAWEEIPVNSRSAWARIEAMVAVHLGEDERAEQALLEALEMDPLDGRVALELARFYTRHEKWAEASNYYERAQKEKSLEFQALIEEARMWALAGDWSQGLEKYRKAESMQPSPKLQKTISELSRSIELRKPE